MKKSHEDYFDQELSSTRSLGYSVDEIKGLLSNFKVDLQEGDTREEYCRTLYKLLMQLAGEVKELEMKYRTERDMIRFEEIEAAKLEEEDY